MGNTSSMLTQYDIEEVQEHCNHTFSQQEIVSLYQRFCQLDRCGGVIFKVYDSDGNGKVAFNDMLDVLHDLTGHFISEQQREPGSVSGLRDVLPDLLIKIVENAASAYPRP
ncbi:hypothetical protein RCOM_1406760 [Ricinus communis]|uniref:EF-hand domain-containing protein n=1 Tax=Ricinus communis TaxID=3988 RepID=B9SQY9_RICCO|nr:hypothetical protein RCOM_1406760 [Ricinus communis]